MDMKHFLRSYSIFKNLDDLQKRIQQLEKKG
jgi:UDP-3-O-[3-hydroxymyristoyl] glucosamine N-acyltransferase